MNYSFLRGLISSIIGAIVGTIGEHTFYPNFWWIGMIVGALVGALALNPKKFVNSVREAFSFSIEKCFCKKAVLFVTKMVLFPFRVVGLIIYVALISAILSSTFFAGAYVLGSPFGQSEPNPMLEVLTSILTMGGIFSLIYGISSFETGKYCDYKNGSYFYLFSTKERVLFFLPEEKPEAEDVNVFKELVLIFNPISLLFLLLYELWTHGFKAILTVFHFSIHLEQLMRKELWSITSLSSAVGALYGHLSHESLLVAGVVGGLSYLLAFGVVTLSAHFAKAFPYRFWVEVGIEDGADE